MGSNDQIERLPGLAIKPRSVSEIFADLIPIRDTGTTDPSIDEVRFSIVCEDCGKHFWSRSKANSHAALKTHVLHEDDMLPDSSATIPESPATSPASTHTLPEVCRDMNSAEQEGSQDSEGDDYDSSLECGKLPCYYGAANNHANLACMQDAEFVPSSAPDGSLTSGILSTAVACDIATKDSSTHPSSPSWNANSVRLPNTTITGAGSSASPINKGRAIPTTTYSTSSEISGRVIDPVPRQSLAPFAPTVSQWVCFSIKQVVC